MNHRTDPRTMEDRWRDMGFAVEWSDYTRGYVVYPVAAAKNDEACHCLNARTVDEVEAYVVAHAVAP